MASGIALAFCPTHHRHGLAQAWCACADKRALASQLGLERRHIDVNELESISPLGSLHCLNRVLLDLAQLRLVLQQAMQPSALTLSYGSPFGM